MPADGEVAGLLALMLLTEARRTARVSASGELVPLDEQDRGSWDRALIAEGHALVRARLASGQAPGRYQIPRRYSNAVHTDARDNRDTDWSQVLALYDKLVRLDPSPIVRLNLGDRGRRAWTARRPRWRRSTVCRWRATTPSTSPTRSCCAAWAGARRRGRRTTGPSSWPASRRDRDLIRRRDQLADR